jgi:hypothetical protein
VDALLLGLELAAQTGHEEIVIAPEGVHDARGSLVGHVQELVATMKGRPIRRPQRRQTSLTRGPVGVSATSACTERLRCGRAKSRGRERPDSAR